MITTVGSLGWRTEELDGCATEKSEITESTGTFQQQEWKTTRKSQHCKFFNTYFYSDYTSSNILYMNTLIKSTYVMLFLCSLPERRVKNGSALIQQLIIIPDCQIQ